MSIPLITSRVYSFVMNFVFVSVPMFVLMAAILDRSGIARDLFDAMKLFAGRIRGGVAVQTVFVSIILAAMSGIIGGEIVLLGLIALPQMLRLGYDRNLAIGVVCAGGSLGTMIPPSIVLIIYGLTANVSIGELFTAAFLPGFMLAMFYVAYILFRAYFTKGVVPPVDTTPIPLEEKLRLLKGLALPVLVVFVVLGSIYGGIASVTEASAIGVGGVILSTILRGEFSYALLRDAAMQTLSVVGMITGISDNPTVIVLGRLPRLGRDRAADDADLRTDHQVARHGPGLVRRAVLHEHAGTVPVATLRPGSFLSEVCCPSWHHAGRYFPGARALHHAPDPRRWVVGRLPWDHWALTSKGTQRPRGDPGRANVA